MQNSTQQKTCNQCAQQFEITADDLKFYDKVSPVIAGKKYPVPAPTLCPDCRLQRRFTWRNDQNLYQRACDISGKQLITMFSPETNVKIVQHEIWWGDDWDAKKYGRDFDFSKTFFAQFKKLVEEVPYAHIATFSNENSLYTNYSGWNKNCYLCFAGNYLEDSLYCYNAEKSKNCMDCLFVFESELCLESVHSQSCYNTKYALNSKGCSDSFFVEDCTSCQNCLMCFNLKNQQYCILNKQYSKEEYFKMLDSYRLNTASGLKKACEVWRQESLKYPKRPNHNVFAENCSGEYITQSKNCQDCYIMSRDCEDCKYVFNAFPGLKDSMDCTFCGEKASLHYECMGSGSDGYNNIFGLICCINSSNLIYCQNMFMSKNCFGCNNMKNAEYCILNKQYTKEEYEKLVPRIIEHMRVERAHGASAEEAGSAGSGAYQQEWGEYFPAAISPFGYNETMAAEIFPLTKAQALKQGFKWKDEDNLSRYQGPVVNVPDAIGDVTDEITKQILTCEQCAKNYKIIPEELKLYRQVNNPVPRKCFSCRHKTRLAMRSGRKQYDRTCDKCSTLLKTSYAPARLEKVYCEKCYLKEVY